MELSQIAEKIRKRKNKSGMIVIPDTFHIGGWFVDADNLIVFLERIAKEIQEEGERK